MTASTDPRKTGVSNGPTLLAASAVAVSVTGTVSEIALATVPVPAGAMGVNGAIMVKSQWSYTNSANNKVVRTRFGGIAGAQIMAATATATAAIVDMERRLRNRGAANSQICSLNNGLFTPGSSTSTQTTTAVDTSVAQDVVFSGQLASAGETITLESYEVWLLP